jgi:hypothetical protein
MVIAFAAMYVVLGGLDWSDAGVLSISVFFGQGHIPPSNQLLSNLGSNEVLYGILFSFLISAVFSRALSRR